MCDTLSERIASLQSSLIGLNIDHVVYCSATWLKICLQPFHSGSLPAQSALCCKKACSENVQSSADRALASCALRQREQSAKHMWTLWRSHVFLKTASVLFFVVSEMLCYSTSLQNVTKPIVVCLYYSCAMYISCRFV